MKQPPLRVSRQKFWEMNRHLQLRICQLQGEIVHKNFQIRYLRGQIHGYGIVDRVAGQLVWWFARIKTTGKNFIFYILTMPWNALFEAAKEPLRLLVLAIIPVLVSYLATSGLDPTFITVATLVLRTVDKILHEVGKQIENETLAGGLTRF